MVRIKFEGTIEKVDKEVEEYFRQYHPCGYQTRIVSEEVKEDGTKVVRIERWDNCD